MMRSDSECRSFILSVWIVMFAQCGANCFKDKCGFIRMDVFLFSLVFIEK